MLDRPELADLVIPDLARWKDWASMDRLVQMFKDAGEKASRLYELNLLAFVLNKFDFWSPKCPNYENIEY